MTGTGEGGRAGDDLPDLFGPLERSGALRGWLLVLIAVVVGAVLLPSGTRAALTGSPAGGGQAAATTTTTALPQAVASTSSPAGSTNSNGAATTVSSFLSGKGFGTLTPVNALTVVHASQVYAVAGQLAAAREVVAALGLSEAAIQPSSTPIPVSSVGPAMVVVIVGPDLLSRT
jgi:hypothetical protein